MKSIVHVMNKKFKRTETERHVFPIIETAAETRQNFEGTISYWSNLPSALKKYLSQDALQSCEVIEALLSCEVIDALLCSSKVFRVDEVICNSIIPSLSFNNAVQTRKCGGDKFVCWCRKDRTCTCRTGIIFSFAVGNASLMSDINYVSQDRLS